MLEKPQKGWKKYMPKVKKESLLEIEGEEITHVVLERKYGEKADFGKLFRTASVELQQNPKFAKVNPRLFLALISYSDARGQILPTKSQFAKLLNYTPSFVGKQFALCVELGILVKAVLPVLSERYFLSPYLYSREDAQQRRTSCAVFDLRVETWSQQTLDFEGGNNA